MDTYNTKPELQSLVPVNDRMSFLYVEKCNVNRESGAISFTNKEGQINVPASSISVLLLGPGCDISHRALELIADSGTSVVWVGEHGVRYYCHGRPLTRTSSLLIKQATMVSNERKRLDVARKMYAMRFPGEDISKMTLAQLRGREGARVRRVYREFAHKFGVPWNGREYDPEDFNNSNEINKALSAANICLYGLAHSVIAALGLSPGLGFIHTGHERSFVYDLADLYKAEISIPISFQTVAETPSDIESAVRHKMRDCFYSTKVLRRMVADIYTILSENEEDTSVEVDVLKLWDNKQGEVDSGKQYSCDEEDIK